MSKFMSEFGVFRVVIGKISASPATLGGVDTYRSHRIVAASVTTAR